MTGGSFTANKRTENVGQTLSTGMEWILNAPVAVFQGSQEIFDGNRHRLGIQVSGGPSLELTVPMPKREFNLPADKKPETDWLEWINENWPFCIPAIFLTAAAAHFLMKKPVKSPLVRPGNSSGEIPIPTDLNGGRHSEGQSRGAGNYKPTEPIKPPTSTWDQGPQGSSIRNPPSRPESPRRQPSNPTSAISFYFPDPEMEGGVRMHVIEGPLAGQVFELNRRRLKIGFNQENDICLQPDSAVSGAHCELEWEQGILRLRDLNSTNKTYVNGSPLEPLRPSHLQPSSTVLIGRTKMRIELQ